MEKKNNSFLYEFGALEAAMRQLDIIWEIKEYLKTVASNDFSLNEILEKATTAESQLQILLKTMDIGIVAVDKDNYVCACNEGAEKILNRKAVHFLEKKQIFYFHQYLLLK